MQTDGLRLLMLLDRVAAEEAEADRIRLALLTANPELARGLYPQYFADGPAHEVVAEKPEDYDVLDEDATWDLSGVDWVPPDEDELATLQRMLDNPTVTVRGTPGAQEEVTRFPGDDPDDAEWT